MIIFLKNLFNFLTDSAYNLNYESKSKAGFEIRNFKAQKISFQVWEEESGNWMIKKSKGKKQISQI